MKHGDFTALAKEYVNRPGYSRRVLQVLAAYIRQELGADRLTVADVGAGTGKLTENLMEIGLSGYAVEPNDAMRAIGSGGITGQSFTWSQGAAEATGLPDGCVDWVLMGSSFHWTDHPRALREFGRILRPGGFFTAIWNPRNVEENPLHQTIEQKIREIVPELDRVSSGSSKNMQGLEEKLLSSPDFADLFFLEAPHTERMTPERYMGAWRSVNDIQVQAGPARFEAICRMIAGEIEGLEEIVVPYKSRAWTVRRTGKGPGRK